MAKYGWKKGQGLGASESGIVNPLHIDKSSAKVKSNNSAQGPPQAVPHGMGGGGRGIIVSDTKTAREKEEKARFGEPSRIICLTNMVGRNEVDDDLPTEVGASMLAYLVLNF